MHFFADKIIKPLIIKRRYRRVCEIGSSTGENTRKILGLGDVSLTIIDPGLDADLAAMYGQDPRVHIIKEISLDALPKLSEPFDCFMIDGDHNWYTVYNELRVIHERRLLKDGGAILFHDVCWPYARRDMYYQPELIPKEFRRPYEQKGILEGHAELSDETDFNATHFNAVFEDGPRNGVLTAIEDFLKEHPKGFKFTRVEAEYGLGLLFKKKDFMTDATMSLIMARAKSFELKLKAKDALRQKLPSLYTSVSQRRQAGRRKKFS